MGNPIRQFAMRLAPRGMQRRLKRWYYPALLRRWREERWPEARIVRRLVRAGDHVVDAGANIGYIALLLSRIVGPAGVVHCFEPVPVTFDFLSNNLRALGLSNVRAYRAAVSDAAGTARMTTPDYAGGGENLYESHVVAGDAAGTFQVDVVRLDDAVGADAPRVRFVKIDVEGHELAAVRGAERLLAHRPALLVEVAGDPDETGSRAAALFAHLAERGYAAFRLDNGRLARRAPGDKSVDYFFLGDEHVKQLAGDIAA